MLKAMEVPCCRNLSRLTRSRSASTIQFNIFQSVFRSFPAICIWRLNQERWRWRFGFMTLSIT